MTMTRGGLVSLVYARSMNLDPKDQAKAGAALTHMNADIELITAGAFYIHELWSSPVEIAVGIWLVERQLGVACLIPVVIAIRTFISKHSSLWSTLSSPIFLFSCRRRHVLAHQAHQLCSNGLGRQDHRANCHDWRHLELRHRLEVGRIA